MAISIDGATRRIILDSDSVTAAEIWSRWVDWHPANPQWPLAFSLVGGQALGGGLFIPPYFFLLNSWRVRPREANHNLTITGNLFVDGGGVPVVSTLGTYQVNVNYTVPVQAQGISTSGSVAPTAEQNAAAVWAKILEAAMPAEEMMRIMLAAMAGKREGLGTATEQYMAQDGVTPRITLTPDENGNGTPILDGA